MNRSSHNYDVMPSILNENDLNNHNGGANVAPFAVLHFSIYRSSV